MRILSLLFIVLLVTSCKTKPATTAGKESETYKVLDSKYITRASVFVGINVDEARFRESEKLNNLILEKSIPELQEAVYKGLFTYEDLTIFYLNRIYKYDRENDLSLNAIIAINPNAIAQARAIDEARITEKRLPNTPYRLEGMPILLKDNINTSDMPTTAGAAALINNRTEDAELVKRLKEAGAIILGKANLSEWAYFFCGDCPSGYSAVGGQTLNPYGRKVIDTGGSSSGSGVAVAANFAVAAVGSETSGSILSPSAANAVVGLKPTTGAISGKGVVPISSYLDTAGPMAKNVIDNAILMEGLATVKKDYARAAANGSLMGVRLGVFKSYKEIPLYAKALLDLKTQGAILVEIDPDRPKLDGFLKLLNLDMKADLPAYFKSDANPSFKDWDVAQVMNWNLKDANRSMPYGQNLFKGIIEEKNIAAVEFNAFKVNLTATAQAHFNSLMEQNEIAGFVSINNYNAGEAAVAFFPGLTVPMGYNENGQPMGLTFIAPSGQELTLYSWAAAYEMASKKRVLPVNYN